MTRTLLSLPVVLVENILFKFDAACVLVISPINEGIRYSGREKKHKKRVKIYVAKWITMAVVDRFCRTPASHPLIISEFVILTSFFNNKIVDARHDIRVRNPQELTEFLEVCVCF